MILCCAFFGEMEFAFGIYACRNGPVQVDKTAEIEFAFGIYVCRNSSMKGKWNLT